jgi:hypothetical protein
MYEPFFEPKDFNVSCVNGVAAWSTRGFFSANMGAELLRFKAEDFVTRARLCTMTARDGKQTPMKLEQTEPSKQCIIDFPQFPAFSEQCNANDM